jgi:hypothetical protein
MTSHPHHNNGHKLQIQRVDDEVIYRFSGVSLDGGTRLRDDLPNWVEVDAKQRESYCRTFHSQHNRSYRLNELVYPSFHRYYSRTIRFASAPNQQLKELYQSDVLPKAIKRVESWQKSYLSSRYHLHDYALRDWIIVASLEDGIYIRYKLSPKSYSMVLFPKELDITLSITYEHTNGIVDNIFAISDSLIALLESYPIFCRLLRDTKCTYESYYNNSLDEMYDVSN